VARRGWGRSWKGPPALEEIVHTDRIRGNLAVEQEGDSELHRSAGFGLRRLVLADEIEPAFRRIEKRIDEVGEVADDHIMHGSLHGCSLRGWFSMQVLPPTLPQGGSVSQFHAFALRSSSSGICFDALPFFSTTIA